LQDSATLPRWEQEITVAYGLIAPTSLPVTEMVVIEKLVGLYFDGVISANSGPSQSLMKIAGVLSEFGARPKPAQCRTHFQIYGG
jgi:hypothetical protein